MAEAEEASSVGDWLFIISSPSSNASESFAPPSKPFSQPAEAAENPSGFDADESDRAVSEKGGATRGGEEEICDCKPPAAETTTAAARNGSSGLTIAESRAARCGFATRVVAVSCHPLSPLFGHVGSPCEIRNGNGERQHSSNLGSKFEGYNGNFKNLLTNN